MIGTVVAPVADFVELFAKHVECSELTTFERRLVVTALMERALGCSVGEDTLYALIDAGLVNANAAIHYGGICSRLEMQRLQQHFHEKVTDIAWGCYRNTNMVYSVSVTSGKVLISTRPSCQTLSFRPGGR